MELGPYVVRDIFPAEGNRVLVYCSVQDGEQCGAVLSFFARRGEWERGDVVEPVLMPMADFFEPVNWYGTRLENPGVPSIDADCVLPDLCIDR